MVGIIVIGCSDFTSTVDIEATVEAIVEATVEARSKQNTPTSTAIPSTSTALPPTATAAPPPTPVSASTDRKKDNTPSPTSISTPVASSQLSVNCSFQEEQLKVSCTANRHQPGTQLAWSSNATSRTGGGEIFDFILEEDLLEIVFCIKLINSYKLAIDLL